MEALQQALINLLVVVIGVVASFIGQKLSVYLQQKGIDKQLQSKKAYADIVVSAIQQIYKEADGAEKLESAKKELVDLLNKNGIKISDSELNILIESAVKGMKDGVNKGSED